jgi:CheY-like chemotaxis protein
MLMSTNDALIIVIDDVAMAAEFIQQCLFFAGFKNVRAYTSPYTAIREIEAGLSPALCITDYEMPGMNGLEFIERLRIISPATRRLIATGNAEVVIRKTQKYLVLDKGDPAFLKKLGDAAAAALKQYCSRDAQQSRR